jgi:hypothetical protein
LPFWKALPSQVRRQGVTENEEEDTSVTISVTLLQTLERLDKLKTFVMKHEGLPYTLFKSMDEIDKHVIFHVLKKIKQKFSYYFTNQ